MLYQQCGSTWYQPQYVGTSVQYVVVSPVAERVLPQPSFAWPGQALAPPALPSPARQPAQQSESNDELAAQATDPTASLMSFQLNDWYTASLHDAGGTINQIVFRSAIPFDAFGHPNIFRITLPAFTNTPSGQTGLGDTTIFNLTVWNESWGRWGAGVSGSLPTGRMASRPTSGPWAGVRLRQLVQQGVQLGPVRADVLLVRWATAAPRTSASSTSSRSQLSAGRRSHAFGRQQRAGLRHRELALGVAVAGRQLRAGGDLGGPKWRPNFEVDYDFRDTRGNPEWVVRAGIVLLLPQ